jgi:hypothetical protein
MAASQPTTQQHGLPPANNILGPPYDLPYACEIAVDWENNLPMPFVGLSVRSGQQGWIVQAGNKYCWIRLTTGTNVKLGEFHCLLSSPVYMFHILNLSSCLTYVLLYRLGSYSYYQTWRSILPNAGHQKRSPCIDDASSTRVKDSKQ